MCGGLRAEVPGVKWNRVLCVNRPPPPATAGGMFELWEVGALGQFPGLGWLGRGQGPLRDEQTVGN